MSHVSLLPSDILWKGKIFILTWNMLLSITITQPNSRPNRGIDGRLPGGGGLGELARLGWNIRT